jgi:DNA-binding NtrC family response regulator
MDKPLIVVAERHDERRVDTGALLRGRGYAVVEASSEPQLLEYVCRDPDVFVVGAIGSAAERSVELAVQLRQRTAAPVILLVAESTEALAVAALRARVSDYLRQPVSPTDLIASVARCLSRPPHASTGRRNDAVRAAARACLIGESERARGVRAALERVAGTHSNVLLTGETGTGKELAAHLIHAGSPRRERPLVSINCAAVPEGLLESEFFGHEKGAFTGAHASYAGKLQLASGGTIFFDEIGDMGLPSQAKILRAIETKEIYRLGGSRRTTVDVRVIAATNQDLERSIEDGRFRKDLYFRLNVARIHMPPLREHPEDIPLLVDRCVQEFSHQFGRDVAGFTPSAMSRLARHTWPGNVRELRNLVEAVFVNLPPGPVRWLDLPDPCAAAARADSPPHPDERDRLLSALLETNWNKSRAAEKLSWSRMTLYRKLAKYRLSDRDTAVTTPNED